MLPIHYRKQQNLWRRGIMFPARISVATVLKSSKTRERPCAGRFSSRGLEAIAIFGTAGAFIQNVTRR